jgi:hypothetical protein
MNFLNRSLGHLQISPLALKSGYFGWLLAPIQLLFGRNMTTRSHEPTEAFFACRPGSGAPKKNIALEGSDALSSSSGS